MLRAVERAALADLRMALVALGDDGRIGLATPEALGVLGWDSSLLGRPLSAIVPPRLRAAQKAGVQDFVLHRGHGVRSSVHRHSGLGADGKERPLQIHVLGFRRPDGSMFLCAALAPDEAGAAQPATQRVVAALQANGYALV